MRVSKKIAQLPQKWLSYELSPPSTVTNSALQMLKNDRVKPYRARNLRIFRVQATLP